MTRKSRVAVLVVAVVLPIFAACADSTVTGPQASSLKIKRDGYDSAGFKCDNMPWGRVCTPI